MQMTSGHTNKSIKFTGPIIRLSFISQQPLCVGTILASWQMTGHFHSCTAKAGVFTTVPPRQLGVFLRYLSMVGMIVGGGPVGGGGKPGGGTVIGNPKTKEDKINPRKTFQVGPSG